MPPESKASSILPARIFCDGGHVLPLPDLCGSDWLRVVVEHLQVAGKTTELSFSIFFILIDVNVSIADLCSWCRLGPLLYAVTLSVGIQGLCALLQKPPIPPCHLVLRSAHSCRGWTGPLHLCWKLRSVPRWQGCMERAR